MEAIGEVASVDVVRSPPMVLLTEVAVLVNADCGEAVCGDVGVRALDAGRLPTPVELGDALGSPAADLFSDAFSGLTIDIIDSAKPY